jgi:hypothetical protein
VPEASAPSAELVAEWVRRGRDAMIARHYVEARDWFDQALEARPDDPQVQGLAVTAEFWRRLAREGDGFAPAVPPPRRAPRGA